MLQVKIEKARLISFLRVMIINKDNNTALIFHGGDKEDHHGEGYVHFLEMLLDGMFFWNFWEDISYFLNLFDA